jgi:D-amino-acid dehydrogenase
VSDESTDVLVIGAGIIGLASAYYLQRAGLKVTLIDQGEPGQACSFGNCGHICPSHVFPLAVPGIPGKALRSLFDSNATFRIAPQMRPALFRWLYHFWRRCESATALQAARHLKQLLDASAAEYRRLVSDPAMDAGWRDAGNLYLFRSERALREYESTELAQLRDLGVTADLVSPDRIRSLTPGVLPQVCGGVLFSGDAFLQPDRFYQSWLSVVRAGGADVRSHVTVSEVRVSSGRIDRVVTTKGAYVADHYVFALGSWSAQLRRLLRLDIPVEPGKGYSIVVDRPAACPSLAMLFPEHNVVATPFASGLRLGSILEFAGFDSSIPEHRVRQLLASAEQFIEMPRERAVRQKWTGWRPMTWDSLPIIGRPRSVRNALVAAGHNMLGMTLAPATGRLVADLAMERTPFVDAAPFSPDRFGDSP